MIQEKGVLSDGMGDLTKDQLCQKLREAHPELDGRKGERKLKRENSGGGALPGTPKDLYFPSPCVNKPPAPVWSFFRCRYSDRLLKKSRAWCFVHEGDAPCPYKADANSPAGAIPKFGASTTELGRHLTRFHGYNEEEIAEIVEKKQWPPQGKHNQNKVVKGKKELVRNAATKSKVEAVQVIPERPQEKVSLRQLDQTLTLKLNAMFARKVVIHDSRPTSTAESDGMTDFLSNLLRICGATHKWVPASHQDVGHALNKDLETLAKELQTVVPGVPREYMVLADDVWEDRFKRHWIGASLCWLDEDLWPNLLLLGFEQLEKWYDPWEGEGVHCSTVAARAIQSAWNSGMGLDGVQFPVWNYSDNASPAIKVGKILGSAQLRCAPHLLAILVRRIVFNLDSDKEGKDPKPPAHPKLFDHWDRMRSTGAYYHKHQDRQESWQKQRKAFEYDYLPVPA